jgi:hypothetical protein
MPASHLGLKRIMVHTLFFSLGEMALLRTTLYHCWKKKFKFAAKKL